MRLASAPVSGYYCAALLSNVWGDWRSGSALRSHRRGHWFEPSIAHQHYRLTCKNTPSLSFSGGVFSCDGPLMCHFESERCSDCHDAASVNVVLFEGVNVGVTREVQNPMDPQ